MTLKEKDKSLERTKTMLKWFREAKPGIYPVKSDQVELIKEYWPLINLNNEFTFNDNFTKIRKK